MSRRLVLFGVALAGAAAWIPQAALGEGVGPTQRLNAADTKFAGSVLLARTDLGSGAWRSIKGGGEPSCGIIHDLRPQESGLVETGRATGPLFTNSTAEALAQTVQVFSTPAEAAVAWTRIDTKSLVICTEEQIESTSSMSAPVSVTNWMPLELPKLATHVSGFRVVASAKSSLKGTATVYFDLVLLEGSRTVTKLQLTSVQKPLAASFEARLVRIISKRLGNAPR